MYAAGVSVPRNTLCPRLRGDVSFRRMGRHAAIRRDLWIKCRVNEVELRAAEARSAAEGLGLSEYIRREICGMEPTVAVRARRRKPREPIGKTGVADGADFDALVERYARTMPRRNAEFLARKRLRQG